VLDIISENFCFIEKKTHALQGDAFAFGSIFQSDLKLFVFNVTCEKLEEVMMQSVVTSVSVNAYDREYIFIK